MTKDELLEKKKQLEERIATIQKDLRGGLDADFAEQAVQLENSEVLEGILDASLSELKNVDEALSKLS